MKTQPRSLTTGLQYRLAEVRLGAKNVTPVVLVGLALQAACVMSFRGPSEGPSLRQDYQKREIMIPMRDGTRLFTSVYRPRDDASNRPILLRRTPYGCSPYGPEAFPEMLPPGPEFVRDGYIVVCQEVRGTYQSEGKWVHMRPHRPNKNAGEVDESTDGYDTVQWLIDHIPGHNGRVGLWGDSYPGFYVLASVIDAHPAIRCAVPAGPQTDWWYEDVFHHGAFFLSPVFWFAWELGLPRSEPGPTHPRPDVPIAAGDAYEFFLHEVGPLGTVNRRYFGGRSRFWQDLVDHPHRDAFWRARNIRPHLRNLPPAVMSVGGWYDESNLFGALKAYESIRAQNPETYTLLVMGPWEHTGWGWESEGDRHGDVDFGEATTAFFRSKRLKPFVDFYLQDAGPDADGDGDVDAPPVTVYETGRNRWRTFSRWPPEEIEHRSLYLSPNRHLAAAPPASRGADAYDEFISDPAHPVPYTEEIVRRRSRTFMTADQRFAARRPDVLSYATEPLESPITVAGGLEARLWVSTNREDADWVVKLIDVFPGDAPDWPGLRSGTRTAGYQMLVRAEVLRGRFREDPARPRRFPRGKPTLVTVPLLDILHTFEPGHRLMIQVQSTWFPLVDRNPQSWVDNIFLARAGDFVSAVHRIHRSPAHPSQLRFGVLHSPDR